MAGNLLVAFMRDEAPYILEWVAHHRAVGFDAIVVFSNDSTDGTDAVLDRLTQMGVVLHLPNPKSVFSQIGVWNVGALRYASHMGVYRNASRVCALDADEFLEISVGDGTLDALEGAARFDAISFPVLGYTSDDDHAIGDGSVQARFTTPRADITPEGWVPTAMAVKTLADPKLPGAHFRNHRPKIDGFSKLGLTWLDGGGKPLPPDFTDQKVNAWAFDDPPVLAHVNHHSLRSRDGFLMKSLRGDVVTADRFGIETDAQIRNMAKYWNTRNKGGLAARSPRRLPAALALEAELHADPILARLHSDACALHAQTAERIRSSEAGKRLCDALA